MDARLHYCLFLAATFTLFLISSKVIQARDKEKAGSEKREIGGIALQNVPESKFSSKEEKNNQTGAPSARASSRILTNSTVNEGIADAFPVFPENIIPGRKFKKIADYPHLKLTNADNIQDFKEESDEDQKKLTDKSDKSDKYSSEKRDEGASDEKSGDKWFENSFKFDKSSVNIIVLVILVALFIVYRIRAGRVRKRIH